jgi:hypothetical protein
MCGVMVDTYVTFCKQSVSLEINTTNGFRCRFWYACYSCLLLRTSIFLSLIVGISFYFSRIFADFILMLFIFTQIHTVL